MSKCVRDATTVLAYGCAFMQTGAELFRGKRNLRIDRSVKKCRDIGLVWELHAPSDRLLFILDEYSDLSRDEVYNVGMER